MEAKAYLRDLRITPRKVKIVLDLPFWSIPPKQRVFLF